MKRNTRSILAGVAAFALLGCGGSEKFGPPTGDEAEIRALVAQMGDASGNAKSFKEYFASGATVPTDKERERYRKYLYDMMKSPSISGDTAKIQVRVRDDEKGPLGTVEWAFVKEGGKWKAKSAPMP